MKKHLVVMFLIIAACTQQPVKTTQNPNIKMVSTFDVALDIRTSSKNFGKLINLVSENQINKNSGKEILSKI